MILRAGRSLTSMTNTTCHMSMSWTGSSPARTESGQPARRPRARAAPMAPRQSDRRSRDITATNSLLAPRGAYVMGRSMSGPIRGEWDEDWRGWWGDEPPYHPPVFVPYPPRPRPDRNAGRDHLPLRHRGLRRRARAGPGGRRRPRSRHRGGHPPCARHRGRRDRRTDGRHPPVRLGSGGACSRASRILGSNCFRCRIRRWLIHVRYCVGNENRRARRAPVPSCAYEREWSRRRELRRDAASDRESSRESSKLDRQLRQREGRRVVGVDPTVAREWVDSTSSWLRGFADTSAWRSLVGSGSADRVDRIADPQVSDHLFDSAVPHPLMFPPMSRRWR